MKLNSSWRIRLAQILLGAALVIALVVVRGTKAGNEPVHLTTDWSHRHLVFSAPHNLGQHVRLLSNPRYVQQLVRRNAEGKGNSDFGRWHHAPESLDTLKGDWSMNMGTGAKVGAGIYPAKFSFDATSANCANAVAPKQPDFVVYNTSLAGSVTQASILAYDNLYATTCSVGSVPSTYWAYDTGGSIVTSPVLSGGGDQVAFVQNNGTPTAVLVLLKWKASVTDTAGAPTNISDSQATTHTVSNAAYRTCTAPCQTLIIFSNANTGSNAVDMNSSPFYDYSHDVLYVGNDNGFLHKFTDVFKGGLLGTTAPAEVVSGVWPANVHKGSILTSSIYDDGTNQVFVADSGGVVSRVDSTTGVIVAALRVGYTNGINDGPVIDLTNGKVYVLVSDDAAGSGGATDVITFATNFPTNDPGAKIQLTAQHPGTNLYSGAFDQQWFLGNGGSMYFCASAPASDIPTLYQVAVSNVGVLSTVTTGPSLATGTTLCSPVTEFYNVNAAGGAKDWIFVSVQSFAKVTGPQSCTAGAGTGCIMSWDVTTGATITPVTASIGHTLVTGGTSAIIVDGSSPLTGASQVYFTPLADQPCTTSGGTGGCAIQASQVALQ